MRLLWNRNPRLKSTQRIVDEIQYIVDKYNKLNFCMIHDLFTYNRKKVLDFCDELLKRNLNIIWSCSARIDTVDDELIEKMYVAGCRRIFFGIEVGEQYMQRRINKNLDLNKLEPLLLSLKRFNFTNLTFSFMYNFPYETEESIKSTVRMALHILHVYGYDVQVGQCCILPNTELYEKFKNELEISKVECSITMSLPVDLDDEWIMKNPDIFSQYFAVKNKIYDKYILLEAALALYKFLYKYYNGILLVMLRYFNGDFFEFYEKFAEKNFDWLIKHLCDTEYVKSYYDVKRNYTIKYRKDLLNYISDWLFAQENFYDRSILSEIVQYENEILDFYYSDFAENKWMKFENDIVGLMHNYPYDECINKKTKVLIYLKDDKTVSAKRYFV